MIKLKGKSWSAPTPRLEEETFAALIVFRENFIFPKFSSNRVKCGSFVVKKFLLDVVARIWATTDVKHGHVEFKLISINFHLGSLERSSTKKERDLRFTFFFEFSYSVKPALRRFNRGLQILLRV